MLVGIKVLHCKVVYFIGLFEWHSQNNVGSIEHSCIRKVCEKLYLYVTNLTFKYK